MRVILLTYDIVSKTPGVCPVHLGFRQAVCMRSPGLPLYNHTTISGTKAESGFIRKENSTSLRSPLSSSLTPQMLQMVMVWCQLNTCAWRRDNFNVTDSNSSFLYYGVCKVCFRQILVPISTPMKLRTIRELEILNPKLPTNEQI